MKYFYQVVFGLFLIGACSVTQAVTINNLEDVTNGGGFFADMTFTNNGADTVTITADIGSPINAGLTKGDILGLWFDFADFSALSGAATFGGSTTVIKSIFSENLVESSKSTSLGGNVNINGSGESNWDLGVIVGKNGSSGGFNQFISFDLTIAGLLESQFQDQRVGMRVQSIEGTTNFSSGSSKLIGTGGAVIVPEPALIAIFGLGLFGLALTRRNTTKRTQLLTA